MTRTTAPPGGTEPDLPTGKRRWSRIPIWIRVSGIVAAVLVAVLLVTVLLAATGGGGRSGSGGGHGTGGHTQMDMNRGDSRGDHGTGQDRGSTGDHSQGSGHSSRDTK